VVSASSVPVTLKIRTGWDPQCKNALSIARIAEDSGIQSLVVHGRTRACKFRGVAEHDTVAGIKSRLSIPVIANGDISSAREAARVLQYTGADGVMIGRAAQGNPWIFTEIKEYLATGQLPARPDISEVGRVLKRHLQSLYEFYGEYAGVRIARKHIGWYCSKLPGFSGWRARINRQEHWRDQLALVSSYFQLEHEERLAA
ncbi:MAG: tRNA-dihydrouridine synthase, partial [Gammaproteobacteria bacterium]